MASKWKNKFNWQDIKNDIEKEKESKTKSYKDDRFFVPNWKMAIEKKKFYTFRFLPDPEGTPYTHYYSHSFKYANTDGSGKKWYINNCISTFGWDPKCPICAKNSEYYDSAYESDKEIAKQRKRKQHWVSNILIVNDPFEPENNGKVFLYKFGYRIFKKIDNQMFPSETDLEDQDFQEFMPYDLFEGADFKLKIVDAEIAKDPVPNYDSSSFSNPRPITNDDEELDAIMEQVHLLDEFTDPKNFPTVEETIKQVGHLLGATPLVEEESGQAQGDETGGHFMESEEGEKEDEKTDPVDAEPATESGTTEPEPEPTEDTSLDDDEAFFSSLKK